jgi:predicted ribosomally synthesized peptide with SipW-like signal peptide
MTRFSLARRTGRHVRRAGAGRRLAGTAALLAGSVAVALIGTGGTYALWNDSAVAGMGTIRSGSTAITVNGVQDYRIPTDARLLGPGHPLLSTLTVKNSGTTSVTAKVSTTSVTQTGALADNLTATLTSLPAGGSCSAGLPGGLTAPLIGYTTTVQVLPVGAVIELCLEIKMIANAGTTTQNGTATYIMTFDAVQVRP